ncbi:UDP-N-acetylmuramoyl-tripeptide--D-alanyl-D-alanine ligase [Candidatus Poribacteria bacterium]|nr:UDP-N-acetylmuramoyl-tripeptide--D-alanyl-D-alanine ligase [Candidatus Poribacteria bacterium]
MKMTLAQMADCTGGMIAAGNPSTVVTGLCTDTRVLRPGDVFAAIRGNRFDGEEFVGRALELKAAGVICSGEVSLARQSNGAFLLLVPDTTTALGGIAREWRRRLDPTVVAITGSCGKTTTKDMTAHLLRGSLCVLSTEGNKNNQFGLPLTLLRMREDHQAAVVELGMNHAGELDALTRIAEPDFGILTNVGDAHIGNFDSRDGLIAAKAELFEAMAEETTAILNGDCPGVRRLIERHRLPGRRVTFGVSSACDVEARSVEACTPFGYRFVLRCNDDCVPVYLPVFGRYQVSNALAAAAAASALGVPAAVIAERLETFQAPEMRSHIAVLNGIQVVEDCYNASPTATVEALSSFGELRNANRRFVLLGDMFELGEFTESGHRRVGEAVARARVEMAACVGEHARWIADEACRHSAPALHFETIEDAVAALRAEMAPGDALLIKGSRAARLERAMPLLGAAQEGPGIAVGPESFT